MKIFFLFFCIFIYDNSFAHPRNIYKNHTYLGMYDMQESLVQLSCNSNYRLQDLAQKQIAFLHHFKHWQFSGSYQQFGNSFYNNHFISTFVGIQFNSNFTFFTALQIITTFILSSFAWIFFRANTVDEAFLIVEKITTSLSGNLFVKWDVFFAVFIGLIVLLLKEFRDEFLSNKLSFLKKYNLSLVFYAVIVSLILLMGVFDEGQFIYFQF